MKTVHNARELIKALEGAEKGDTLYFDELEGKINIERCPKCHKTLTVEDNRADTDRGVYGSVVTFCEYCGWENE